ncbi:bifunctional phosphopantothenoylcysteine decarboxylase/phosphopantothenate synthase [Sphingomonas sp. AP4-R1]|uniref:bifunctional phosphopantothenoylcysteine decarboxylase/phosphopantothenate synthase n=1 Tax=Sphingomonas sp. AP4-R1 TaxID=2735134 RepID=UPI0014939255|nr:bifunctional phosphopantothenoylcysteine decarboxylase/phosphopantothenate synthase [Sphingomonas sp. AP4-R1]QJU59796.1 bifunctional phosphopantothenoylcysteine decarboxylase/phosphopantothenate synthase [Sphingomonas sp. AP4-R1]
MIGQRILLIVGGGIAAYKACELIRALRKQGATVRCVLTAGGAHFVTPMTLAALSEQPVHTSLWDLKDEAEMGHIQLSREADLVVVCPATADLMAKMAAGIADDLATTLLLATDKPVLAVPAMNVRMWGHAATRRNVANLRADGVTVLEPDEGPMACGEYGPGRLPEIDAIVGAIGDALGARASTGSARTEGETVRPSALTPSTLAHSTPLTPSAPFVLSEVEGRAPGASASSPSFDRLRTNGENVSFSAGQDPNAPLAGKRALVTAGPTHEPIDPVRYIANRSSGKQGFAIAAALARLGAEVTLIAGPVTLATPPGVRRVDVETALQMQAAVDRALPADVAVLVAAVADWRMADEAAQKIKKTGDTPPTLALVENPDILAGLAASPQRPALLIGFAAETESVMTHAMAKRARKNVDWIVANDVSGDVMGGDRNSVHIVTARDVESWPDASKEDVASRLAHRIAKTLGASV